MKKYQVGVITGTRAEYGLLRELLFRLRDNNIIDLKLIVTGSHLSSLYDNTEKEIMEDGFCDYIKIPIPIENDSKEGMAISAGVALQKYAETFSKMKLDIAVVLGDRYEILSAAIALFYIGIPIAHISGGDVTEGAVDDAIRHCLTKISSIHFPGCEQSAKRIIQMGEQPNRVHNVGEPGVENCLNTPLISRDDLSRNLEFEGILKEYAIVTFHPVTMECDTAREQVYELIKAMDCFPELSFVITMANADAGGREINQIWREEGKKRKNWLVVSSLGVVRYLSAMKYASIVLGNSSSGIVEAPSMGIPTVNIGDRQKGRMMAKSIVNCAPIQQSIVSAMQEVREKLFQEKIEGMVSPFGDGNTSREIEKYIVDYLESGQQTNEKSFYDIKF